MSDRRPETMPETDVVDLILHQHSMIRDLFGEVESASGDGRREAFDRLVRLLAVHETAEEEVVHPLARRSIPEGGAVVDDRLHEEHEAKEALSRLEKLGPDSPEFVPLLRELRDDVLLHARSEERYELFWIRQRCSAAELRAAAAAVKAAEAIAPTHPHPGVESAAANLVVGTPTAIVDRVRDAIRKVRDRDAKDGAKG